jgi:hypothetical protein
MQRGQRTRSGLRGSFEFQWGCHSCFYDSHERQCWLLAWRAKPKAFSSVTTITVQAYSEEYYLMGLEETAR